MEKASPGRVSEKSRNLPGKTRRQASGDRAVGELAFEGFGGGRLAILEAVADDELRYTDLTRRLSASEGEVSRNLARLVRAGLLEKQPSGRFRLTALGYTLRVASSPLRTLALHSEYFRSHDLSGVPRALLARLDDLA